MPRTQIPSSDEALTEEALRELLQGVATFKNKLQEILTASPENLQAHKTLCSYVKSILDIHKTLLQVRALDPESLLILALRNVVLTLMEKGETGAAEVVGRHLEEIGEKIRETWRDPKMPDWVKVTMKSVTSSQKQTPRSAKLLPARRKPGKKEPSPN
ncbi:MAG: hypothetical protein ACE5E9_12595 [Nitrospinaceae bacterium]